MINAIMAGIALVKSYLDGKSKAAAEKTTAAIEKTKQHLAGWSDEYLLLVWSYPFWSMFVPGLAPHTHAGFAQIALLPQWYVNTFIGMSCAVFGIKKIDNWVKRR